MHNIDDTFWSFHGSGYLVLDDKSSPMVGYKFVLRRDNFTGGGVMIHLEGSFTKLEHFPIDFTHSLRA